MCLPLLHPSSKSISTSGAQFTSHSSYPQQSSRKLLKNNDLRKTVKEQQGRSQHNYEENHLTLQGQQTRKNRAPLHLQAFLPWISGAVVGKADTKDPSIHQIDSRDAEVYEFIPSHGWSSIILGSDMETCDSLSDSPWFPSRGGSWTINFSALLSCQDRPLNSDCKKGEIHSSCWSEASSPVKGPATSMWRLPAHPSISFRKVFLVNVAVAIEKLFSGN